MTSAGEDGSFNEGALQALDEFSSNSGGTTSGTSTGGGGGSSGKGGLPAVTEEETKRDSSFGQESLTSALTMMGA